MAIKQFVFQFLTVNELSGCGLNFRLTTRIQVGEISARLKLCAAKFQRCEISARQNFHAENFSRGENSTWRNFHAAKILPDEISCGEIAGHVLCNWLHGVFFAFTDLSAIDCTDMRPIDFALLLWKYCRLKNN